MASPQGFAFGPDGTLYVTGNRARGKFTVATVRRGVPAAPDSIHLLTYLFLDGSPPAPPFEVCGPDPTSDAAADPAADLGRASSAGCG